MSNSGLLSKAASGRMLDDGSMSGRKEMGDETGFNSSTFSRNILQRYLHADRNPDRRLTQGVTGGEIDPIMGSVFPRPISPVHDFPFRSSTVDESDSHLPETPIRTPITTPISSGEHRFPMGGEREDILGARIEPGNQMHQIDDFGSVPAYPSGDFRYLSASLRQSAIDVYNKTPQARLGGISPHDLIYQREEVTSKRPEGEGTVPERFHLGRESLSVIRNVTVRESKRPKARAHDQNYQRRSSMSPSHRFSSGQTSQYQHSRMGSYPQGGGEGTHQRNGGSIQQDPDPGISLPPTPISRSEGGNRSPGSFTGVRGFPQGNGNYEINLTYEGRVTRQEVSADMLVSQLRDEAATIYHLDSRNLILVLFGMHPHTLEPRGRLSDQPPVGPGATVLVFNIAGIAMHQGGYLPIAPAPIAMPVAAAQQGLGAGSKL